MSKGLDENVKKIIMDLLKKGKSTKEILSEVPADERKVRSFVVYERGKLKKSKTDPLGAIEYINDLEAQLKEKNEIIAKLEIPKHLEEQVTPVVLDDNELTVCKEKIEKLKTINKELLDLI